MSIIYLLLAGFLFFLINYFGAMEKQNVPKNVTVPGRSQLVGSRCVPWVSVIDDQEWLKIKQNVLTEAFRAALSLNLFTFRRNAP